MNPLVLTSYVPMLPSQLHLQFPPCHLLSCCRYYTNFLSLEVLPTQPSIQVFITTQCDLSPTVLNYFINDLLIPSHFFSLLSAYFFPCTCAEVSHSSQNFNPTVHCFLVSQVVLDPKFPRMKDRWLNTTEAWNGINWIWHKLHTATTTESRTTTSETDSYQGSVKPYCKSVSTKLAPCDPQLLLFNFWTFLIMHHFTNLKN